MIEDLDWMTLAIAILLLSGLAAAWYFTVGGLPQLEPDLEKICHIPDEEINWKTFVSIEKAIETHPLIPASVRDELKHKFEVPSVHNRLLQHLGWDAGDDHRADTRDMLKNFHHCSDTLEKFLKAANEIATVATDAQEMMKVPYDSNNAEHEKKLDELWRLLRPEVQRNGRITSQWGEIGFQGQDPATDFRGMGVLGLEQLLQFAKHHNHAALQILKDTQQPGGKYFSFAITGINLTAWMMDLFKKGHLHSYFFRKGASMQQFHELYAQLFEEFNDLWLRENPPNVMSFGPISEKFLETIRMRATKGSL